MGETIYPEVTLAEAREGHLKARKVLASGIDPNSAKQENKRQILLNASNSFDAVAREWHEIKVPLLSHAMQNLC